MIKHLSIENYPNIKKATLSMAYDNGCINSQEPESQSLDRADQVLQNWPEARLDNVEHDLAKLSEDQLNTFCCGEEVEAANLPITLCCHELIGQIFEVL